MSNLTELEIFACLLDNLKGAADDCDIIAKRPESGIHFDRMRKRLMLVEGACRQAAYWREDTRWLPVGIKMEQAHQIAREWLHRPTAQSKKLFTGLGAALRKVMADIERLQKMATGRTGLILPEMQAGPMRETRPIAVSGIKTTPGGLILPG